jgi:uncharacterized protein (TIGR03435 family)
MEAVFKRHFVIVLCRAIAFHQLVRIRALLCGVAIVAAVMSVAAQPQSTALAFEVGTIKPTGSPYSGVTGGCRGIDSRYGANDSRSTVPIGRCVITAGRLSHMMGIAFNIPLQNISGFPEWDGPSRFDLEAKAEDSSRVTERQLLLMLQKFLTDQFKLSIRRDTKQGDIFVLVVGKSGSKNLVQSENGESVVPTPSGIAFTGCTMGRLAQLLTTMPTIARPVKDMTGLQGRFDFKLNFMEKADEIENFKEAFVRWDSVFTDIQQELGLRLEASKGPIDTLVVEHAEKPTPN